jgi:2-haloalkanoic acid dehalogenase type II
LLGAFAELEPKHQAATPDKLYPELLAAVHRDLAGRWGIAVNEEEAVTFGRSVKHWPAFDDSAAALQYLKKYYKLIIISNVDRTSFRYSNDKLGVSFDEIITAQDVGSYKPDWRNFEYMISRLADRGIARDEILHTAQSLFHDIAPARAAGLSTMWINRRKHKKGAGATAPVAQTVRPDFEVASLAEFVRMHQAEGRA